MNELINEVEEIYYKSIKIKENELVKSIYKKNDKFFDIFNRTPVFNILNLLKIDYFMNEKDDFFVSGQKVESVNGRLPWEAFSEYSTDYEILFKNGVKKKIKYPEIIIDQKNYLYQVILSEEAVYLKINSFSEIAFNDFEKCSEKILIIDLRGNSGGDVNKMLEFLENFICGQLLLLKHKNKLYTVNSHSNNADFDKLNLQFIYILVDGDTASSAEFFAQSLKERGRCCIVGQETYGKWVIHKVISAGEYYIKIPQFKYVRIDDKDNQSGGIVPDIMMKDNDEIDEFVRKFNIELKKCNWLDG